MSKSAELTERGRTCSRSAREITVLPGGRTGMLMGRHKEEYPVSVGLAEESIFCCEAVESKGLYKVGGREGHVVYLS